MMKPHWQIYEQAYRLCPGIVLAGGKFCYYSFGGNLHPVT